MSAELHAVALAYDALTNDLKLTMFISVNLKNHLWREH